MKRCHLFGMSRTVSFIAISVFVFVGCRQAKVVESLPVQKFSPTVLGDQIGLHNVIQINDFLFSGSSPEGEKGFQSLKQLGIKTIITVDGAMPEIEIAKRFGMRYVHLPIGYDDVPRVIAVKMARAMQELPKPIYVHCHHGKHRGPAAAMAALRCIDGNCLASEAIEFLKRAGTDPKYLGLYAAVERSGIATADEFNLAGNQFPESAKVPDFVRVMVEIDEKWDRIKLVRKNNWKTTENQPLIDASHELLLIHELFRESHRLNTAMPKKNEFEELLKSAEYSTAQMQKAFGESPIEIKKLEQLFTRTSDCCMKCHEQFRDHR